MFTSKARQWGLKEQTIARTMMMGAGSWEGKLAEMVKLEGK
ncbi:hypothetical protein D082_15070 [Synechocystis sp. PCC 6714]|nr:hypothetical protein D082_15070 [Synechocystis sp. PCC 6714]